MNIIEAGRALRAKKISSVELTTQALQGISRLESKLNSFLTVTEELAKDQARRADAELAQGQYLALVRVPDCDFVGTQTVDVEVSGSGFSFGGGFLYFFNPKWALDVGLNVTTGEFDTVKFDNISISGFEIDATSARLKVGVTWFPMSGR